MVTLHIYGHKLYIELNKKGMAINLKMRVLCCGQKEEGVFRGKRMCVEETGNVRVRAKREE